ncbi:MAG: hypothetical protein DRG78_01040 [Epsilonproteobacteria bacterium]|nr:MAG: hypothetical protein DRG78_01040 [Campylobacterota bacterium]
MIYVYGSGVDDIVHIDNNMNVVVFSASFCWFKILDIPMKNLNKAKKLANHMLNDRPAEYTDISLQRYEDRYKVYCYNKNEIEDIVKTLDKDESKIYFAYELSDNLLHIVDNTAFVEYLKSSSFDSKNIKPILSLNPNRKQSVYKIATVNVLLGLGICVYSVSQYGVLAKIDESIAGIKIGDKSSYEIKSSIKIYENKDKKSKKLRESLTKILKKNDSLKLIEYKKGTFSTKKTEGKS